MSVFQAPEVQHSGAVPGRTVVGSGARPPCLLALPYRKPPLTRVTFLGLPICAESQAMQLMNEIETRLDRLPLLRPAP